MEEQRNYEQISKGTKQLKNPHNNSQWNIKKKK